MRVLWIVLCLLSALLSGCGAAPSPPGGSAPAKPDAGEVHELKIAAASDLKFALEEVVTAFHASHAGVKVTVVNGSSGQLYTQLAGGAPFDIFLSADIQFPRKLVEEKLAIADSKFLYAHGHLVIWVKHDSPLDLGSGDLAVLADPAINKIAIANPKIAPYGRAAEAALQNAEVYDQVESRLVLGENVVQTAQFVESGAADVGIIALSLALSSAMQEKGRYVSVPEGTYPPLEQRGVIMKRCEHPASAVLFCDFLQEKEGRAILSRYGFVLPEE